MTRAEEDGFDDDRVVALIDRIATAMVDAQWGAYDPSVLGTEEAWTEAKKGHAAGSWNDVEFVVDFLRSLPVDERMAVMGMDEMPTLPGCWMEAE